MRANVNIAVPSMRWKQAARVVLHKMGGLAALRLLHRNEFRVLMFHEFREIDREKLDAVCGYITRQFEPVTLTTLIAAIHGQQNLPPNAIAVTVDDGYRNFLHYGHPIFRRHRIPTALYVVAGFSEGQLWLWTDQVAFAIEHTEKKGLRVAVAAGESVELDLSSTNAKNQATERLWEMLKLCPNEGRLEFLARLSSLFRVEIPPLPPEDRAALNWAELRALAEEEVDIGCHTYSHPILSRIRDSSELDREIQGAKELSEMRLRQGVRHFCYPNGRDIDISDASVACVKAAGFSSSVTCTYGLNPRRTNPFRICRVPFDSATEFQYGTELLAGLHM